MCLAMSFDASSDWVIFSQVLIAENCQKLGSLKLWGLFQKLFARLHKQ